MAIRRVNLELSDSISGFFTTDNKDYFYQMSGFTTISGNQNIYGNSIFNMRIFIDKYQDTYSRQVYTLSMVLQDIGGFYTAMFFIGLVLYSLFRKSLFSSAMVRQLYLVQLKARYLNSGNNDSEDIGADEEGSPPTPKKNIRNEKKVRLVMKKELEDSKSSTRIRSLVKNIYKATSERKLLYYSCCSRYMLAGARFFLCILPSSSNNRASLSLLRKGENRLMKEIDIINVV
jgi:hypothetical protein